MNIVNYLCGKELGKATTCFTIKKSQGLRNDLSDSKPDISPVLSRLQCRSNDVFLIPGHLENSAVPPFQSRFCYDGGYQNIYSLASEEGNILLLDSNKEPKKSLLKEWSAHDNAIFDTCWTGHDKLITASGDKTAILWDVLTSKQLAVCKGHGCSLKTLSIHPENKSIFASGARDGNIMLWDVRCQNDGITCHPKFFIGDAHDGTHAQGTPKQKRRRISRTPRFNNPLNSITCVQFQDENTLLSTGSSDRMIKGWDLRFLCGQKGNIHKDPLTPFELEYPGNCVRSHGYTSLILHPNRTSFFVNCTDGVIYRYSCSRKNPKLVSTYYGHKVGSFFVKMDVSPDGNFIISGSSDALAYVWKVSKPGVPVLKLSGHEAEVTAVAWCPSDVTKIITCSDDDKVLNWKVGTLEPEDNLSSGINPIIGKAETINPNEIFWPRKSAKSTLSELDLSSNLLSPVTPSTSSKRNSPALTQWFTPTSVKSVKNPEPTPPKTPLPTEINLVTPIKCQLRPALGDLSLKTNVTTPSAESFASMKKRLIEEQQYLANINKRIRRTLDLESPAKEEKPSQSIASVSKENVKESSTNSNSDKGSDTIPTRKSLTKKCPSPKKSLRRCLKSTITSKKPSYSIKRFFTVISSSKNT